MTLAAVGNSFFAVRVATGACRSAFVDAPIRFGRAPRTAQSLKLFDHLARSCSLAKGRAA
jgi:hypothetical protein